MKWTCVALAAALAMGALACKKQDEGRRFDPNIDPPASVSEIAPDKGLIADQNKLASAAGVSDTPSTPTGGGTTTTPPAGGTTTPPATGPVTPPATKPASGPATPKR